MSVRVRFRTRARAVALALSALTVVLWFTQTPAVAADHFPFGPLSAPRAVPGWRVTTSGGSPVDLRTLLRGHITALQLMFTSCNAICPLQGAAFAKAQQLGGQIPDAQFVSLSIDPAHDTPAAMAAWLTAFGARAGWLAVTPRASDVADVFRVLDEAGLPQPTGADPHSGQVYIVNREGVLVYRTAAMPSARVIVDVMQTAATTGWP